MKHECATLAAFHMEACCRSSLTYNALDYSECLKYCTWPRATFMGSPLSRGNPQQTASQPDVSELTFHYIYEVHDFFIDVMIHKLCSASYHTNWANWTFPTRRNSRRVVKLATEQQWQLKSSLFFCCYCIDACQHVKNQQENIWFVIKSNFKKHL